MRLWVYDDGDSILIVRAESRRDVAKLVRLAVRYGPEWTVDAILTKGYIAPLDVDGQREVLVRAYGDYPVRAAP